MQQWGFFRTVAAGLLAVSLIGLVSGCGGGAGPQGTSLPPEEDTTLNPETDSTMHPGKKT